MKVDYFDVDLELRMKLKNSSKKVINEISEVVSNFVKNWNNKSEINGRRHGVIHNFRYSNPKEGEVNFKFDWGSASDLAMVKLLETLSKTNKITSVHLGSVFSELSDEVRFLKGKIVSEDEPIIGAKVFVSGNLNTSVRTNLKGEFILEVPKNKKFKVQIDECFCANPPKPILIKKSDKEILLNMKGCNFRKKRIKKKT